MDDHTAPGATGRLAAGHILKQSRIRSLTLDLSPTEDDASPSFMVGVPFGKLGILLDKSPEDSARVLGLIPIIREGFCVHPLHDLGGGEDSCPEQAHATQPCVEVAALLRSPAWTPPRN